tara:strand:+ start:2519 stop:3739 length:1221 start_codon:yes stop_codon:yes gene_type:complete
MTFKPQVLFVHTNYPAQFRFLVKEFCSLGWEVWFASHTYKHPPLPEIKCITLEKSANRGSKLDQAERSSMKAFQSLLSAKRNHKLRPIFTYVHTGWGLGQFIKDLFPNTKMVAYSEWWFNLNAADFYFDLKSDDVNHSHYSKLQMVLRNQSFALELQQADFIVSPTKWQRNQLPKLFRDRCNVIFDGIDSNMFSPGPFNSIVNNEFDSIVANKPLLTYATRGLEPYRGFPEFVRAAEELLKNDPDWHVAIAGEDKVNYHQSPKLKIGFGQQAKERFTSLGFEKRVHFLGSLPLAKYRNLLRSSNLHCYFTRPFVLSWSLLESALTGCKLLTSSTQPVQEFLDNDSGSLLTNHTSKELSNVLIDYACESKVKDLEKDRQRRSARKNLVSITSKSNCVKKHLDLIRLI